MQENGAEPTIVMLFDHTHKTKRTGEFVDTKSKKVNVGS